MEMKTVFFMNGDVVVKLKMVNEGERYFDIVQEIEYTIEELKSENMYLTEEEAWEAYEEHRSTIIFDEE